MDEVGGKEDDNHGYAWVSSKHRAERRKNAKLYYGL
jgi:hypothetical protein